MLHDDSGMNVFYFCAAASWFMTASLVCSLETIQGINEFMDQLYPQRKQVIHRLQVLMCS